MMSAAGVHPTIPSVAADIDPTLTAPPMLLRGRKIEPSSKVTTRAPALRSTTVVDLSPQRRRRADGSPSTSVSCLLASCDRTPCHFTKCPGCLDIGDFCGGIRGLLLL